MTPNFSTLRNGLESAVIDSVLYNAARYPSVAADDKLINDVACIALNHLPARYLRGRDAQNRGDKSIDSAVLAAYDWVYAQTALTARELVVNIHREIEWAGRLAVNAS
jgi:hypothetical protein